MIITFLGLINLEMFGLCIPSVAPVFIPVFDILVESKCCVILPPHVAQVQIEGDFLPCSFSILEDQPMDMLLGLDMLKRHQV